VTAHKIFASLLVFVIPFQSVLAHSGIPNSRFVVSYLSFMVSLFFILRRVHAKQLNFNTIVSILIFIVIGLLYSILATQNENITAGLATFKTFFSGTLILLFLLLSIKSARIRLNFHYFILRLLTTVAVFTIAEFLLRLYYPIVFSHVVDFVRITGVGGLTYLKFGGGWGIQPIGIFFDMHTHTTVFVLSALLAYVEKNRKLFFLALIALILSFRVTSFVAMFVGISALIFPIYALILMAPIGIYGVYLFAENLPGESWSVIKEHALNNFNIEFDRSVFDILFGSGYQRIGYENVMGYNEIFMVRFLYSFGGIGILLMIVFAIFILIYMRKSYYRYDRLGVALILTIPINLFHYNIFFQPFVIFIYVYFAFHVHSQKRLGYSVSLLKEYRRKIQQNISRVDVSVIDSSISNS
jgi:hypothetical protein